MHPVQIRLAPPEHKALCEYAERASGISPTRAATMAVVRTLQLALIQRGEGPIREHLHKHFRLLRETAKRLRTGTITPEVAAAAIDALGTALSDAVKEDSDDWAHVVAPWCDAGERAGIDWKTGRAAVQTERDVRRLAAARDAELAERERLMREVEESQ